MSLKVKLLTFVPNKISGLIYTALKIFSFLLSSTFHKPEKVQTGDISTVYILITGVFTSVVKQLKSYLIESKL